MASFFGDCAREELIRAFFFIRSRLVAVLKEKSDLTTRVDTAEVRVERLRQEKYDQEGRVDEYATYSKKVVKAYNDLTQKYHDAVEYFTQRSAEIAAEREQLKLEKENLIKLLRKSDNCLTKTRVAFVDLKQHKKEQIDHFIEMGLNVEKRLAESQAACIALQQENAEKTAQLNHIIARGSLYM